MVKRSGVKIAALAVVLIIGTVAAGGPTLFDKAMAVVRAAPSASSAASSSWSGAIIIQNNGTVPANVVVNFFSPTGVLVKAHALLSPIPAKGSVTVDTQTIPDLPSEFAGSAMLSSSEPVTAAMVGYSSGGDVDRTIYTGFADGSPTVYVPAISNNYADQTSILAVQNVEGSPVSVTIRYYERFTGALAATVTDSIPANSSHYYDSGNLPGGQQLAPPWSGAALVQASGRVVSAVHQPYLTSGKAVSFEGQASVGTNIFLPSAMFQYAGQKQTTFIAVQNTQASPVNVDILFYDKAGNKVGTTGGSVEGFRKLSWNPGSAGIAPGYIGSAVVKASAPVAAMVNIGSETDLAMAYGGVPSGTMKMALPYIRWAPSNDAKGWRTFIAVMNTSETSPTDAVVRYYDTNGALVHTVSLPGIAPGTKGNHNPGVFIGDGGAFVGTVEVEATLPVATLVNAITVNGSSSASYTGVPIP